MNHWLYSLLFLMVFTVVQSKEFGSAFEQDPLESDSGESPEYDAKNNSSSSSNPVQAQLTEKSRGPLGEGFNVHTMHLLTNQLQATGAKIFKNLPYDECVLQGKPGPIQKYDTFFSNTESFYSSISTSTKIDASIKGEYTLGASVSAATNTISSGNTQIQGMSLNLKSQGLNPALKKDCINKQPLDEELVQDFEKLEADREKPWLKASWDTYQVFLEKYGSHIVDGVVSGSSVYQYVFAKSSEDFSQRDFTIKACLSLAGPTEIGEVGVSACSGVSEKDVNTASKLEMVQKFVIRGATAQSRAGMTGALTQEKINQFLQEGLTNPSPISYTFYPIWEILKSRYIGTKSFVKAVTLEEYYKGYLSFGCPYIKTANGFPMQRFNYGPDSQPEHPIYVCELAPDGCHVKGDCHEPSLFACTCHGDSCIQYKDEKLNSGQTKKVAYAHKKEWLYWEGCEYWAFDGCRCTAPLSPKWTVTWSGETAKRRDQARSALKPRRH